MPCLAGDAAKFFQPVLGAKRLDGREALAAANDFTGYRPNRCCMIIQESAQRCRAFRQPRAGVQQAGGFQKRFEIDFDTIVSQSLEAGHTGQPEALVVCVAEEVQLTEGRNADPYRPRLNAADKGGRRGAAESVGVVFGCCNRLDRHDVGHRQAEDRYAVQRTAGRHNASGAERAAGRLQADNVVEAGRNATRACGVGAKREGNQPRGHRHGAARR